MSELFQWLLGVLKQFKIFVLVMPWETVIRCRLGDRVAASAPGAMAPHDQRHGAADMRETQSYTPRRRPPRVLPGSIADVYNRALHPPAPFPLARTVAAAALLTGLIAADVAIEGVLAIARLDEERRERWARDGSTFEQRFWLGVYECCEAPARLLRKGALYAIGRAGDATDWGEGAKLGEEVPW